MHYHFRRAVCLMLIVIAGGCAWVPQKATLQLSPRIEPSDAGRGTTVFVKVTDRRPSPIIGHRGLDSKQAAITTQQNVPQLFEDQIRHGLAQKGFQTTFDPESAARVLNVDIEEISYKTDMDFWKGSIVAKTVLRVSSRTPAGRFEQAYTGIRNDTALEAPSASTNQRLINQSLSAAVEAMFQDKRFINALAL